MRKDLQEALESAVAEFEKRQQAKQERLRERERFETDWARIRTAVVLPALEEVAVLLRKAGWQCEVRAGDKDPGVHFTVYRGATTGASGGEKPFMTYQPEKQNNTVWSTSQREHPLHQWAALPWTKSLRILSKLKRLSSLRALLRKSVS